MFYNVLIKTRNKLSNRNLDIEIHDQLQVDEENKDNTNAMLNKILYEKLSKNSPYVNYFKKIVEESKIEAHNNGKIGVNQNRFYFPELFKIVEQHFYSIPLWSGLVIGKWQIEKYGQLRFTRLSNNPCENYIGHVKNHLLLKKDAMPSELCAVLYERLQTKYFMHYYIGENFERKPRKIKDNIEKWQKKKVVRREKGFYYKNYSSFGLDSIHDEYIANSEGKEQDFDSTLFFAG